MRYILTALESEASSFPHLSALLASLTPSSGPTTRSAARTTPEESTEPNFELAETPIPELTIDEGMDAEMVWEQMELRGQTVDRMMDEMFGQEEDEDEDEDGMFEDEEGEGSEEDEMEGFDMTAEGESEEEEFDDGEEGQSEEAAEVEYYRRLGEGKEEGLDSEDPLLDLDEDEEGSAEEADDQEQADDTLADEQKGLSLENFDGEGKGKRARPTKRLVFSPFPYFQLLDAHLASTSF